MKPTGSPPDASVSDPSPALLWGRAVRTRLAGPAVAVAMAASIAAGAGGCASSSQPAVQLTEQWPAAAGDYREVSQKWTRRAREHSGPDPSQGRITDQTLALIATFKSPEWRAAYVKFRAAQYRLPPSEVAAMTEREKADAAKTYEVELLVATYDRRLNELQRGRRSVWRIALVDSAGAEIVASEIQRDRRPRSEIIADFPQLGDFHQAYVARFPHTVDLLRPDAGKFSLKMTSSQVGVELVWAGPGAGQR